MNPENVKRIVVKLGTNSVVKNNRFNSALATSMAKDISKMVRSGKQVIIVSSGAIGIGLESMRITSFPEAIEMQQAVAAIGQSILMHDYQRAFSKFNQVIAQVLLTQEDLEETKSLGNIKRSLNKLLSLGVVPIINENDAVATHELSSKKAFSDNDVLSAMVASHLDADLLVMVSEVGGLFTENPESNGNACLIERVSDLQDLKVVVSGKSNRGRGGFKTKLAAAEIALKKEIPLIITKGKNGFLANILKGEFKGTIFER